MTALLSTRGLTFVAPADGGDTVSIGFPDFDVHAGELVSVVGPSHSGKSILMSLCAGLLAPSTGVVERATPASAQWGDLTFVTQALLLLPELTVAENIALGVGHLFLAKHGAKQDRALESVTSAAEAVDVARLLHRRVDELSVGERQRVMVARATVSRPRLVIADEPAAHQDAAHAAAVFDALLSVRDDGGACMIFTRGSGLVPAADQEIRLHR